MNSYRIAGLSVLSEITLAGLLGSPPTDGPDVTIRRGPVPTCLDEPQAFGPTWQMTGGRFLMQIPGIARFLLQEGRQITFEPEGENSPDDIAIFLIGTVFGILLHQREQIVLHASAVRVGGKAVLFCGPSGAGKSTLAAALGREGFPLVTDDLCAVVLDGGNGLIVQPDGRYLKLWAQAIDNLDLADNRGSPVRRKLEKFYVEPHAAFGEPLPLGAVYALREARPPHAAGIEHPNIVDRALLLRRNAYRPRLVRQMGQKANYFRSAAIMADTAGVFHLTRALDFARMPEVLSRLRDHWAELGLLEAGAV